MKLLALYILYEKQASKLLLKLFLQIKNLKFFDFYDFKDLYKGVAQWLRGCTA